MPDQLAEMAAEYIPQLVGQDADDAFFRLIEADHTILPMLIDAYHAESNPELRAALVEVIWQHRQTTSLEFLGEALRDDHSSVWKQALDGLVTFGTTLNLTQEASLILTKETIRLTSLDDHAERISCIDEALDQINELEA